MCNQKEMFLVCLVFLTLANNLTDSRSLHKHRRRNKSKKYLVRAEEMGPGDDIIYPAGNSRFRRQVSSAPQKWEGNTIPFVIASSYSEKDRDMISNAMKTIQRNTCLTFKPKSENEKHHIYFTNEYHAGCQSFIGRTSWYKQILDLQTPECTRDLDTILHEILHALGFWHEISRPDRDEYVIINYENIKANQKHNFDIKPEMDTSLPYDYLSVMHYSKHAFTSNKKPTIEPRKPGAPLGQHNGLSELDIKRINLMYNCYNSR